MKLNTTILSLVLSLTTCLFIYLTLQQCSDTTFWKGRSVKLHGDSAYWHGQSIRRDNIIFKQGKQIDNATAIAYNYRSERDKLIIKSDEATSRLTVQQRQGAYYRALIANRTLDPVYLRDTVLISLRDTALTNAGLKTARREVIARTKADSLELSVAMRDAQISDLKDQRDRAVRSSVEAERVLVREAVRKRPLGIGRRKAMLDGAEQVKQVRQESDLERELNPYRPN